MAVTAPGGALAGSFFSEEELAELGLESFGHDVRISRKASLYHPERISVGSHVRIDDYCVLSACKDGFIRIGSRCYIGAMSFIEATSGFTMEDFATLAARVTVYGGTDDYSGLFLTNPCVPDETRNIISGPIRICRHAIVGTCCVVMPGVTVGEGTAVGASSLVLRSLEPGGIFVGVPARYLKPRENNLFSLEAGIRDD
ncbi:MAG: acyltransferase [Veillonellaceae bacterium]|nr:acyltransferase [Veillonellaceae bacterium]